jgi:aspartyl protease family protein
MSIVRAIVVLLCLISGTLPGANRAQAQQPNAEKEWEALSAILERLNVSLPMNSVARAAVMKSLEELSRERCDQDAIIGLADALQKGGYRRDAATAHIRFSDTCNGHAPSLAAAVNILLTISDHPQAATVATKLIELEPFDDNGYYLRALAYDRSDQPKKAIDDYVTAIELFGDKNKIASVSYFNMARNYERLGQFCDAVLPIEAWIALNPARNETSQTRAMISSYMAKGKCPIATAGREDVFPVARKGEVVTLRAAVNGVQGNFILDTGATFVSLKKSFADKANVTVDHESRIRLHTANGVSEGKRGRATSIQLRTLAANDVPVVVQADDKGTYGSGIEGLLGMSFLSRFHVTIDARSVKIRSRKLR